MSASSTIQSVTKTADAAAVTGQYSSLCGVYFTNSATASLLLRLKNGTTVLRTRPPR
jgi:hypothetical protein